MCLLRSQHASRALVLGLGLSLLSSCCPKPRPGETLTVEVGTRDDHGSFQPLSEVPGVLVVRGFQGGNHIWVAVRARGFDTRRDTSYGVRDADSGELLTQDNLRTVTDDGSSPSIRTDDGDDVFTAFVKYADYQTWVGRRVVLFADVRDGCHGPVHGEATSTIVEPQLPDGGER